MAKAGKTAPLQPASKNDLYAKQSKSYLELSTNLRGMPNTNLVGYITIDNPDYQIAEQPKELKKRMPPNSRSRVEKSLGFYACRSFVSSLENAWI